MSSTVVDLVILFHTESGSGTLQEIGKFDSYPSILNKTRVLFPHEIFPSWRQPILQLAQ